MTRMPQTLLTGLALTVLGCAVPVGTASVAQAAEQVAPQGEDPPGADQAHPPREAEPNPSLTERLQKNEGVIDPPATGDTDIHTEVPNPEAGTDEEVIKPNELEVQPPSAPK